MPRAETANHVLCTYRVAPGVEHLAAFEDLIGRHWPTLHRLGLVEDTPHHLLRRDEGEQTTFVELFAWRPGAAAVAHQHREVAAIWEPMAQHTADRDGRAAMEFPHFAPWAVSGGPRRGIDELAALDSRAGALAHPVRRHIRVVLRARSGTMTAGQIAARFDCTWPTTSRHLKVLVDAGLVRMARDGRQRHYTLCAAAITDALDPWLDTFRSP